MAFHVACPITCRRICFCSLGFPRDLHCDNSNSADDFLFQLSGFLDDPSQRFTADSKDSTVQVLVPRVSVSPAVPAVVPAPAAAAVAAVVVADGGGDVGEEASAISKRLALQKKAAAAMLAAEDFARRFESGHMPVVAKDTAGDEHGVSSNANVLCRMCFLGEPEGSERARRMLSCKSCGKKYHRSCLKSWSQHRDLFHWSSWNCPSCRTCEICRRTGDPNKFVFCKRCDGAYHCYCQHPPHKNVSSGPYLCPKHTKCHSCASTVPGNGLSVRWFLGYTCCDACGRLFVKGNYCPVCLKVYRDSESTPMVCCDICQRWVHCSCDGISDEKYLQFQMDGNLQYKCATCRGECYQVKDPEDAVQELWRRRDKADQGLISSLRAAAGLPTQEDIFSITPFSDDEDSGPAKPKSEFGRSIKLSLKGLVDNSPKKSKEYGKKSSNKKSAKTKGSQAYLTNKIVAQHDIRSLGRSLDENNNEVSNKNGGENTYSSSVAGIPHHADRIYSANQPGVLKHKFVDEVMVSDGERKSRIVRIKNHKPHDLDSGDDTEKNANKFKSVKANKLVINLGARKINVTSSPKSDGSSCQRDHELTTPNGSEDTGQHGMGDRSMGDRHEGTARSGDGDIGDHSGRVTSLKFQRRERNVIKFGKPKTEISNLNPKSERGSDADGLERVLSENTHVSFKRNVDGSGSAVGTADDVSKGEQVSLGKQPEVRPDTHPESNDDSGDTPIMQSSPKDSKFSLKLKIKNLSLLNQYSRKSPSNEEKSSIRGQRSKRKRPSNLMEKSPFNEEEVTQSNQDSEMMEASWILKKLGKDAVGKRVEVHQPSDNSWHKGLVSDTDEEGTGKMMISVTLDDGRAKTLELGKQAVRFVPQKQKRSKT
ncbi:PHD finger family protein [Euphorbia peplus]|nr:PHD finger family protein [Euphorbia peplus]